MIIITLISIFLISPIEFGDTSAQESEGFTDDVDALSDRGATLDNSGQYEEAIVYYDRALDIDPNHVNALYNKGVALGNLGRYQEAIEYYDRALAIEPNFVYALNNKANAIVSLGESCPPGQELNLGRRLCERPVTESIPQNETAPIPQNETAPIPLTPDVEEVDCSGDLVFNPGTGECECPPGSLQDGDECFPDGDGDGDEFVEDGGGGGDDFVEDGGGDEGDGGGDEGDGGGDEGDGGGDEGDGGEEGLN